MNGWPLKSEPGVPRVEKYKIGAADFRDFPLYLISRRFIYERSVKYATIRLRNVQKTTVLNLI